MSSSGVFGRSAARASRYTCGSRSPSIESVAMERPSSSSVETMSPTRTPATFTGWPRPAVSDCVLSNSTLSS